jgi:ATP-dependent Clp protease ATP-binding subunit ClpC
MDERLTDRARKVMQLANQEAQRFHHEYIDTEHILLGLVKEGSGAAANVLKNLDIDLRKVRQEVEKIVQPGPDMVTMGKLPQTPRAKKVIEYSIEEARNLNHNYVGTEHLLLGLLREQEGVAAQVLMSLGLKLEDVREEVLNLLGHNVAEETVGKPPAGWDKSKTPALNALGRDLTELARQGKLDPIFGRTDETYRVVQVLGRRTGNNAILVGEAGVGKTAIVEGLAQLIAGASAPAFLRDIRIQALDLGAVLQGGDDARSRIRQLVEEARRPRRVILFFDPLYSVQVTGAASIEGFDLFKLPLVQGEIQCIATATPDQWRERLAGDAVVRQVFEYIPVAPPSRKEALEVLRALRDRYEAHHRVQLKDEALEAAVELSDRYLVEAFLPLKAIRVMDDAGSLARLKAMPPKPPEVMELDARIERLNEEKEAAVAEQDFERAAHARDLADKLKAEKDRVLREWVEQGRSSWENDGVVDAATIAEVVSKMTGIRPSHLRLGSAENLLQMKAEIREKVVAQEEAIEAVEQAVRRGYAGLQARGKPLASFLFAGPAGVGKTLLARTLAEFLFGDPAALVHMDMAAYRDREDVARFVGVPGGPAGAWEDGGLIEKVRRRPHGVILLDGIEDAHADVHTFVLRILREGVLTDRFGRTADFRQTILILKTPHDLAESVYGSGAGGSLEKARAMFKTDSRTRLRRELVDQVDEVVAFRRLNEKDLEEILGVELARLGDQVKARGASLDVAEEARRFLVDHAGDPDRGARGLQRAVERFLGNPLSKAMLQSQGEGVLSVRVDPKGDGLLCETTAAGAPPPLGSGTGQETRPVSSKGVPS